MDDILNPDFTSDEDFAAYVVARLSSLRAREWENYGYHRVYINTGLLARAMSGPAPRDTDKTYLDIKTRTWKVGMEWECVPEARRVLSQRLGFDASRSASAVKAVKDRPEAFNDSERPQSTVEDRLDTDVDVAFLDDRERIWLLRDKQNVKRWAHQLLTSPGLTTKVLAACLKAWPPSIGYPVVRGSLSQPDFPWWAVAAGIPVDKTGKMAAFILEHATDSAFLDRAALRLVKALGTDAIDGDARFTHATLLRLAEAGRWTRGFGIHAETTPEIFSELIYSGKGAKMLIDTRRHLTMEQIEIIWPYMNGMYQTMALQANRSRLTTEGMARLVKVCSAESYIALIGHKDFTVDMLTAAQKDARKTVSAAAEQRLVELGVLDAAPRVPNMWAPATEFSVEKLAARSEVDRNMPLTEERIVEIWEHLNSGQKLHAVIDNWDALTTPTLALLAPEAGANALTKMTSHPNFTTDMLMKTLEDSRATPRNAAAKELAKRGIEIPQPE